MVLLMIAFVTTTLTVGIALNGVINRPYQQTREATAGPDVTADASPGPYGQRPNLASITPLIHASGVTGHSGPFPYAATIIRAHGHKVDVLAEGRDTAPAPVDQPEVTQGSWVREGGVVIERGFAEALGVHAGDQVTLGGRSFPVAGIAITAAVPAYPVSFCNDQCDIPMAMQSSQSEEAPVVGLVWVTRPDAKSLAASASPRGYLGYLLDLKLAHPAQAQAFVAAHTINNGPGAAQRRAISRTTAPCPARRHHWHTARHLSVPRRDRRAAHRPASMAATRRTAGSPARHHRTHCHSCPRRRPSAPGRDPRSRNRLIPRRTA